MDTNEYTCPRCGLAHEQAIVSFNSDNCVKHLGWRISDLEQKLKLLAQESEKALNTLHDMVKKPENSGMSSVMNRTYKSW
jgi:hypothetical protein